jgi:membrane associated rhomboid family serine protease
MTAPGARFEDPVALVTARSRNQLEEAALVLRAVGIAHEVLLEEGMPALVVPRRLLETAREELARYEAENPDDTSAPEVRPRRTLISVWPGLIAYAGVLLFFFIDQAGAVDSPASLRGRLDANAFLDGQWWRCITALTLHVDTPHLAGNMLFGAAFGALLAQLLGNGVGWGAILACGALGNALDALIQPFGHVSMGASTAVFAALGILTALSLRLHAELRDGRIRRWAPLVMGIALLGLLGTGGTRTDVPAHVLGFAAGLLAGAWLAPAVRQHPPRTRVQWIVGSLSMALLIGAWVAASASPL